MKEEAQRTQPEEELIKETEAGRRRVPAVHEYLEQVGDEEGRPADHETLKDTTNLFRVKIFKTISCIPK